MKIDYQHKMAAHCENGAIMSLLNHYGVELSEAMIFGIGSGIYFSHIPFIKLNGLPLTSFRPWPGAIFKRAARALDLDIKVIRFSNPEKAMAALDSNLEKGIPTGMVVGVFYLDYFPEPYRFHFNAHNIIGVGKEDDKYIISDPIMESFEYLPYDSLKKVRFAQGLQAPKGKMYYIQSVPENVDIRIAVIKGIKRTVKEMMVLPGPVIGVRGIKYLSKKVRSYPKKFSPRDASKRLGQIVRMQEEIGTGGAGFRFLFAAFLQEASAVLENPKLNDLSARMTQIGDMWREFAVHASRIVKERNEVETYDSIADLLLDISEEEKMVYRELATVVRGVRGNR